MGLSGAASGCMSGVGFAGPATPVDVDVVTVRRVDQDHPMDVGVKSIAHGVAARQDCRVRTTGSTSSTRTTSARTASYRVTVQDEEHTPGHPDYRPLRPPSPTS